VFNSSLNQPNDLTHFWTKKRVLITLAVPLENSNLKNNVNSFVNNIIGDGVDRVSEMISTTATDRNRQKEFKIDNKLSTNSQQNEFNRKPFDLEQIKQHQYSGLVFEKQSISSQIIADDYSN
jgi:hypothetical protein